MRTRTHYKHSIISIYFKIAICVVELPLPLFLCYCFSSHSSPLSAQCLLGNMLYSSLVPTSCIHCLVSFCFCFCNSMMLFWLLFHVSLSIVAILRVSLSQCFVSYFCFSLSVRAVSSFILAMKFAKQHLHYSL